jgi:sugar/nucleoside kinase (ribokinase family)
LPKKTRKIIVAGYICLDLIPNMDKLSSDVQEVFRPGNLVPVGPVLNSAGGAVPNTGMALHRLGFDTSLIGKVGIDLFGEAVIQCLNNVHSDLSKKMIRSEEVNTSYSWVISPPGLDRLFFHFPGANDDFCADDVSNAELNEGSLLHFGYPPFMKQMYAHNGRQMEALFARAKLLGLTTSLDMAKISPIEMREVDWRAFLIKVMPKTDLFLPSFEEIYGMMYPESYLELCKKAKDGNPLHQIDVDLLHGLSEELIAMGTAVVVFKLGDQGLYVRSTSERTRLSQLGKCAPEHLDLWLEKELLLPCYQVDVVGTTGSGDSTISGFLAGLVQGLTLQDAAQFALAVGAFSVEAYDATSGIPESKTVFERIEQGWNKRDVAIDTKSWQWDPVHLAWYP